MAHHYFTAQWQSNRLFSQNHTIESYFHWFFFYVCDIIENDQRTLIFFSRKLNRSVALKMNRKKHVMQQKDVKNHLVISHSILSVCADHHHPMIHDRTISDYHLQCAITKSEVFFLSSNIVVSIWNECLIVSRNGGNEQQLMYAIFDRYIYVSSFFDLPNFRVRFVSTSHMIW